ncbi:MAG: hypothetical protein R3C61_10845 [Bacteroidia bacterium]
MAAHLFGRRNQRRTGTRGGSYQTVTGVRPVGFRGPGSSFSENVLRVLAKRGYKYDASTLPNILNPLARAYFLSTSKLSKEEREQRKGLFGSWKDGFRPLKPYKWTLDGMQLTEIPGPPCRY